MLLAVLWLAAAGPSAAGAAAPAADSARVAGGAPADVRDLGAWLEHQRSLHGIAFPDEARLFFRRGLLARESGARAEAARLVHGAIELDPAFVAPRLTLASWTLFSEPSQALFQVATVIELARGNFLLQHALAANALYLGIQALFLGLLAVALLVVALRVHELRHPWQERLARWISPVTARWWSWAFVVLPFMAGLGPVLPTLAALGLLWPVLRVRERVVFCGLLGAVLASPLAVAALDRMASPLNEDRAPLFGVPLVENEAYTPEREARLAEMSAARPDHPHLHFALAWMAKRGGDLARAEAEYRQVLRLWPDHDRALVNLGAVVALQGRDEEALALFARATDRNPASAAGWFNASQVHTRRFDFKAATDALSRASALDFELVKTYQERVTADGHLPLVDVWLAPEAFWTVLARAPARGDHGRAMPPSWRGRIEAAGWPFSAVALLVTGLALAAGVLGQRRTPLRVCSNCDAVVCRRCAHRRRERALCPACAELEARAESPEFARVLLAQHRRRVRHAAHLAHTAGAALIPGFGLLAYQRVFRPLVLLTITAALASGALGMAPPFDFEPHLRLGDAGGPAPWTVALWILVYAISLLGYFHLAAQRRAREAQLAAPTRSRSVQASRHVPPAAAA